jgi:Protein of unknown function (DUF3828)
VLLAMPPSCDDARRIGEEIAMMTILRRGFVFALLLATTGAAFAAEPSARDFLNGIYSAYKGKNSKGVSLSNDAAHARYFTPALAKLIEDDAADAAKAGDVPSLEGDPFIDAQDWQINSFAIAVKETGPDKALGTVTFKNLKENMAVELDLKLKEGWRIDEIRTKTGSLRDLFKKK